MDMKSFQAGRDEGLLLADKVVDESGPEGLKAEIRFRNITGVRTSFTQKELHAAAEDMKRFILYHDRIAMVAAVHDALRIGPKRMRRVLDKYNKLGAYLYHGWMEWIDVIQDIKARLKIDLEDAFLTDQEAEIRYAYPTMEDCYDSPDWVDNDAWRAMLRASGFHELPDQDVNGKFNLYDPNGVLCFSYTGGYQRIQMYDFLMGVVWQQDHEGKKAVAETVALPAGNPTRTRKKKRKKR